MDSEATREDVLRSCGAGEAQLEELLAYTDNPFGKTAPLEELDFPLDDEPHVAAWTTYALDSQRVGAIPSLSRRFVQLRFPIEAGISQTEPYRAATRRGRFEAAAAHDHGVTFENERGIELSIHPSMGGRIPVIVSERRSDFVSLVQAFSSRNEPEPIPDSMGACIVTGLNNWDRVSAYRRAWEEREPREATEEMWQSEFREAVVPRKELYQDRFIILSSGPYSGCSAASVGFDETEWSRLSPQIRREHEFTHYFTFRLFGSMRNHVLDELIADFVGLFRVLGRYDAELASKFLGIESYPHYREGGRLQNYVGDPPVSAEAFRVLQCLSLRAVERLHELAQAREAELQTIPGLARIVHHLSRLTLEQLAEDKP